MIRNRVSTAAAALVLSLSISFGSAGAVWAAENVQNAQSRTDISGTQAAGGSTSSVQNSQTSYADAQVYDYSRKGSVSFTMKDTSDKNVGGGSLTYYKIAAAVLLNDDNTYVIADDFSDAEIDLSTLENAKEGAPDLAERLAKYARNNSLKGTSVDIGSDGKVSISGLDLGIYLVVQGSAAKGYEAVNPFIVTVPYWDGTTLSYDVDAAPKVSRVVPSKETSTETKTTTTTTVTNNNRTINNYNNEDTEIQKKLMQTGQLWWPVPLLLAAGVISCAAGAVKNRASKKK